MSPFNIKICFLFIRHMLLFRKLQLWYVILIDFVSWLFLMLWIRWLILLMKILINCCKLYTPLGFLFKLRMWNIECAKWHEWVWSVRCVCVVVVGVGGVILKHYFFFFSPKHVCVCKTIKKTKLLVNFTEIGHSTLEPWVRLINT